MTESTRLSDDTLAEQQAWLAEQADAIIQASGISEGWYELLGDGRIRDWTGPSSERSAYIEGYYPRECAGTGTGQNRISLHNDSVGESPVRTADQVRHFWEAQGWTVSPLGPQDETGRDYRADREDGAILTLLTTPDRMVFEVYTSCSADESVGNWMEHARAKNEFEEELATREQAAE
ncbi:hypothetical protein QBL02_10320 [Leucobacter sp. UT-8R-CII-1-4]|uniref:hypothetical protein n=1 Tax=Leucobacter sp. UT-8R-CII-1-4 TaxID=3040075 RepID=UPI0024A8647C|nr:hypothetical protein [Leucobacter sp. UT-8R-CII-1-4]MDI6023937.1 hypothetical protein [Leucobacter sp. UT-8R-CII-1-4]